MKKRLLVIALALLMAVLSACSSGGKNAAGIYDEALDAMRQEKYAEAAEKLSGISFYQDSVKLTRYCRAHAWAAEGKYGEAIAELESLGEFRDAAAGAAYYTARKAEEEAENPVGRVYAAGLYDADNARGFKDASERAESIRSSLYQEGRSAERAEVWTAAMEIFGALGDYRECSLRYRYAAGRMYQKKGEEDAESFAYAVGQFDDILDFQDSADRKQQCLEAAYKAADRMIAEGSFDAAEAIYQILGGFCDPERTAQLAKARTQAAEAARQGRIAEADALLEEEKYDEARRAYQEAGEEGMAREALYRKAAYLARGGKAEDAAALYLELSGYKDSREQRYLLGKSLAESDPGTASRILLGDRDYPGAGDDLYAIALAASAAENYPLSIAVYGELSGQKDCTLRMMNDMYLYGRQLMDSGDPEQAAEVFGKLAGIGSSDLYRNMAGYAAADALEAKGAYEAAAASFAQVAGYEDAEERADNCRYLLAVEKKTAGQYEQAAEIFASLGAREDSAEQEKDCRYLLAQEKEQNGQWEGAISLYSALGDYAESGERCAECRRLLGRQQLADGKPEEAYASFVSAGDAEGQAEAAFAAGERKTAEMDLEEALKWYLLAPDLPETAERTAMIAESLLNMEEDALSEQYASVADGSEKARAVFYALALRSLERGDEETALRQMKQAGDSADAAGRFEEMLGARVEALLAEEKYDDAVFLCLNYGEQERADGIRALKAQKEEEEKQKALEAGRAEREAKENRAAALLAEGKYEEAAALYTEIGEADRAAEALTAKEEAEQAARAEEEAARAKAGEAEKQKLQARLEEAAALAAAGDYDGAIAVYEELNEPEMVNETIYQEAAALDRPDLYLTIPEYKDSRERHYLAGRALLESDPEKAFAVLAEDITYADVRSVLYGLAEKESEAENWQLSSAIFAKLASQPLDPEDPKPDCLMRSAQDLYRYGMKLKEQGDLEAAAQVFGQLAETGDAQARTAELNYLIAGALEDSGKYIQAAAAFEAMGGYGDAAERAKQNRYNAAKKQLEAGAFDSAEAEFTSLGDFGDAAEMVKECRYQEASFLVTSGEYAAARESFAALDGYASSAEKIRECVYRIAGRLLENGQYPEALAEFETVADYADTAEKIKACHAAIGGQETDRADAFLKNGETEKALEAYRSAHTEFEQAGSAEKTEEAALRIAECYQAVNDLEAAVEWYRAAGNDGKQRIVEIADFAALTEQYGKAEALALETDTDEGRALLYSLAEKMLAKGDEDAALRLFGEAGEVRDAKDRREAILQRREQEQQAKQEAWLQGIQPGNRISFGRDENGKAYSWIILEEQDGILRLIAEDVTGEIEFNEGRSNRTSWQYSTLRVYLNVDFLENAFSEEERQAIELTKVKAEKNPGSDVSPGSDTEDYVFVLNVQEAERFGEILAGARGGADWWLRSPTGKSAGENRFVAYSAETGGYYAADALGSRGVRPVIRVRVDALKALADAADTGD